MTLRVLTGHGEDVDVKIKVKHIRAVLDMVQYPRVYDDLVF